MVSIYRLACILPKHWFEEHEEPRKEWKENKSSYKILEFPGGNSSSLNKATEHGQKFLQLPSDREIQWLSSKTHKLTAYEEGEHILKSIRINDPQVNLL